LGEPLAIDLANTVMVVREGEMVELLNSEGDLERWLELERPRLGDCRFAIASLEEVKSTREDVRALFTATASGEPLPNGALERVNGASAAAPVALQLQLGDNGRPAIMEDPEEIKSVSALLGSVARSALRLVTAHEEAPLRLCNAPSCGMFFVGRRKWCCAACGNRARAARHYRRRASARRSRESEGSARESGSKTEAAHLSLDTRHLFSIQFRNPLGGTSGNEKHRRKSLVRDQ
jgi:predicted RNA-binding Zn ribbon-like protein